MVQHQDTATAEPFGAWLLKQTERRGWVSDLAKAAKGDRAFPREGSVEQVGAWLDKKMASGDDWEALEDAQRAWEAGQ